MNAFISVIRWLPIFRQMTPVAFAAAAAPPAPPTGFDIPLSLVEAGLGTHYIRVTVASS